MFILVSFWLIPHCYRAKWLWKVKAWMAPPCDTSSVLI